MKRIPFDPKELIPIGEEPGFFHGMPGRPVFPTPRRPGVSKGNRAARSPRNARAPRCSQARPEGTSPGTMPFV